MDSLSWPSMPLPSSVSLTHLLISLVIIFENLLYLPQLMPRRPRPQLPHPIVGRNHVLKKNFQYIYLSKQKPFLEILKKLG